MNTEYALSTTSARAMAGLRWPAGLSWKRLSRRVRAYGRLIARRHRARRRYDELQQLDELSLRDLGMTRSEIASVVTELGGRVAATRRRTDLDVWLSASSRFRVRAIDSSL